MTDYYKLNAKDLIKLVRSRQISAVDMVQSHLQRIDALDNKIKAWVYLDKKYALEQADIIDQQIKKNEFKGTLFGVPVGVKDIFNTIDMPTGMGSIQWEGFTPGNDARVIYYIRTAGAVFPGKTVTAEFAVHAPGKTVNPHHYEYSPGTSSSGSAAAVASMMVPLAVGTQTAGSIIRPASYCGIYGFKPSFGLLPRTGVLKTADTLDTIGMFARDPADLKLLFEIMRVHGENFPISHQLLNDPNRQVKGNRPWKVALIPHFTETLSEPYARKDFNRLIEELRKIKSFEFTVQDLPKDFDQAHDIHERLYERSLSYYFRKEFSNTKFISQIINTMISNGQKIPVETYYADMERQENLSRLLDTYFKKFDAIMTLSTQGIAPKLNDNDKKDTCLMWTLCGNPTINIPAFKGPENMPFGLQIVGCKYNDYLLLDLAQDLHQLVSVKE